MGSPNNRIYCTWHVLRAWRTNVNTKIKTKEKRDNVFKMLQTLLCELDEASFKEMVHEVLKRLSSDEETHSFYQYFEKQYINKEQYRSWAYCYRINVGINANMSIEKFNNILKNCYLKGKQIRQLDKTLCATLCLLIDKVFDLIIKMNKGKLVGKMQILRKRHKASLLLDAEKVLTTLDDKWQVLSSTQTELYTVKWIKQCTSCQLQCTHCNSCFHEFACSCMDSAIQNNMCKHIHLVCRTLNNSKTVTILEESQTEDVFVVDISNDEDIIIEENILHEVSLEKEESVSLNNERRKLLQEFQEMQKYLQTVEQFQYVRRHMRQLIPTLKAMNFSA